MTPAAACTLNLCAFFLPRQFIPLATFKVACSSQLSARALP